MTLRIHKPNQIRSGKKKKSFLPTNHHLELWNLPPETLSELSLHSVSTQSLGSLLGLPHSFLSPSKVEKQPVSSSTPSGFGVDVWTVLKHPEDISQTHPQFSTMPQPITVCFLTTCVPCYRQRVSSSELWVYSNNNVKCNGAEHLVINVNNPNTLMSTQD